MIAIALGALSLLVHTLPVNEIPSELFKVISLVIII